MQNNNSEQKQNKLCLFDEISQEILRLDDFNKNSQNLFVRTPLASQKNFPLYEDKINTQEKQFFYNDEKYLDMLLGKENDIEENLQFHFKKYSFLQAQKVSDQISSNSSIQLKRPHKAQMNKVYTKNYREKKKQETKSLREQNDFLKKKVQDLSFRLREAQMQINKLKHADLNLFTNFNTIKDECVKQVENILAMEGRPFQEATQIYQKLKNVLAISNKPKLDYLNYLMSQLLQNLISDQGLYFVHSLQNKSGIWRQNDKIKLSLLDSEILELLSVTDSQNPNQNMMKSVLPDYVLQQMKKIKSLWKNLYEDYINFINHGLKVQALCSPLIEKKKSQDEKWVWSSLKLRMHFEKIKYRKDMRELRQLWFKQTHYKDQYEEKFQQDSKTKRTKLMT